MRKKNPRPLIQCLKFYIGRHAFYDTATLAASVEIVSATLEAAAMEKTWFAIDTDSIVVPSSQWRTRSKYCVAIGNVKRKDEPYMEYPGRCRVYVDDALTVSRSLANRGNGVNP